MPGSKPKNLRQFIFYRLTFGGVASWAFYFLFVRDYLNLSLLLKIPYYGFFLLFSGFLAVDPLIRKSHWPSYWPQHQKRVKFTTRFYVSSARHDCNRVPLWPRFLVLVRVWPNQCCRVICRWDEDSHCQHHFDAKKAVERLQQGLPWKPGRGVRY